MDIKALIFDMDGLLLDTEKLHVKAWQKVLGNNDIVLDPQDYEHSAGVADAIFFRQMQMRGKIPYSMQCEHFLNAKTAEMLKMIKHENCVRPFPGIRAFLNHVHKIFPAASASNSPGIFVKTALQHTGLMKFFMHVVTKDDIINPKPDPEIYLLTAKIMGCEPGECIVFEDSEVGVKAAKSAGMICIAVGTDRAGKLAKADVTTEKLAIDSVIPLIEQYSGEH